MIRRFLLLCICLSVVLSIGGVYAIWFYSESSLTPKETTLGVTLNIFDYPPEQVLPGGDTEQAVLGQNHFPLLKLS